MKKHTCSCCAGHTGKNVAAPCPKCKTYGVAVSYLTVSSLARPTAKKKLTKGEYFLCTDPNCPTAYYRRGSDAVLSLEEINTPLHYKKSAKIKYACYCNELTFAEAISTAKKKGISDWAQVVREAKGKLAPCACEKKNPFGKCCSGNSFAEAMRAITSGKKAKSD